MFVSKDSDKKIAFIGLMMLVSTYFPRISPEPGMDGSQRYRSIRWILASDIYVETGWTW